MSDVPLGYIPITAAVKITTFALAREFSVGPLVQAEMKRGSLPTWVIDGEQALKLPPVYWDETLSISDTLCSDEYDYKYSYLIGDLVFAARIGSDLRSWDLRPLAKLHGAGIFVGEHQFDSWLRGRAGAFNSPIWTYQMVLHWIVYRDPLAVQLINEAERVGLRDWFSSYIMDGKPLVGFFDAEDTLRSAALGGELSASAYKDGCCDPELLVSRAWENLNIAIDEHFQTYAILRVRSGNPIIWRDLRFTRPNVMSLWPPILERQAELVEGRLRSPTLPLLSLINLARNAAEADWNLCRAWNEVLSKCCGAICKGELAAEIPSNRHKYIRFAYLRSSDLKAFINNNQGDLPDQFCSFVDKWEEKNSAHLSGRTQAETVGQPTQAQSAANKQAPLCGDGKEAPAESPKHSLLSAIVEAVLELYPTGIPPHKREKDLIREVSNRIGGEFSLSTLRRARKIVREIQAKK